MSPICKCIFEHLVRQDFQNLGDRKGTKVLKNVPKSHKSSVKKCAINTYISIKTKHFNKLQKWLIEFS